MSKVSIKNIAELKRFKADPGLALYQAVLDMRERNQRELEEALSKIDLRIEEAVLSSAEGIEKHLVQSAVQEVLKEVRGPQGKPGPRGLPGKKPVKGVDFFTKTDEKRLVKAVMDALENKKTKLISGVDFVSPKEVEKIVSASFSSFFSGTNFLEREAAESLITRAIREVFDAAKIARGIEALTGKARLSYNALKDKPDIPGRKLFDDRKPAKTKKGGGGGNTGASMALDDLSSQCDGATKAFTVSSHSASFLLVGTQFPFIYRPTIDFTTSGTTLQLTDEVGAPEAGQTLLFTYAE